MSNVLPPNVTGVPRIFIQDWLARNTTGLCVILVVFGALDLLFVLPNLGSDMLAVLANLITGVVCLSAAAVIKEVWRPDATVKGHVVTACMVAMWVSLVWNAYSLLQLMNMGIGAFIGLVIGGVLLVATMVSLGTAASVIKGRPLHA